LAEGGGDMLRGEVTLKARGLYRAVAVVAPFWVGLVVVVVGAASVAQVWRAVTQGTDLADAGLGILFALGWAALCGFIAWPAVVRQAVSVRYPVRGQVVFCNTLRQERWVLPEAITEVRQQLLNPMPGVYRIRHSGGVEYFALGRSARDFVNFVRSQNPAVRFSQL
jgi:hypothetical protein